MAGGTFTIEKDALDRRLEFLYWLFKVNLDVPYKAEGRMIILEKYDGPSTDTAVDQQCEKLASDVICLLVPVIFHPKQIINDIATIFGFRNNLQRKLFMSRKKLWNLWKDIMKGQEFSLLKHREKSQFFSHLLLQSLIFFFFFLRSSQKIIK